MYPEIKKLRHLTHHHVLGSSGVGKSKFLEWLMRKDILSGRGFMLIDWHSPLFAAILNFLAYVCPERPIYILNPSRPDFVLGFNRWQKRDGDISTRVSRDVAAFLRPWGVKNSNDTPELERVCRMLFYVAAVLDLPLPLAALLLRYPKKELRQYVIAKITDSYMKEQWNELDHVKTLREWREQVRSVNNRLARFVSLISVKRFMGMRDHNISIEQALREDAIVLVNLGASPFFDRDAGRIFGSLLLNELFECVMQRVGEKPETYPVYLDEFQEILSPDLASMLDQVRKGGLHLVLAHQRLGQLERDRELLDSIITNAKIRTVFGGLPVSSAEMIAQEMFWELYTKLP